MSSNKVRATQCPKCGNETNTATALSCGVCAHPLRENLAPVKARQAFIGKGALSSKTLHLSRNPPSAKSTRVEKTSAPLRWIALILPPLLLGAGYLIGFNARPPELSNSIPSNDVPPSSVLAPSRVTASSANQSSPSLPTQRVEVPAEEPPEKLPLPVKTKALEPFKTKPVKEWGVPLQKKASPEAPPLSSPVKPPVQAKSKRKSTQLTAERPPIQTNQTAESAESKEPQPIADTPSAVVIDNSEANAGTPAPMDCYGGQSKQSSMCRNRKN
jgi:hypothetical protein